MITHESYSTLTSLENIFQAWSEFKKGKRKRKDVQIFERHLEDNLFGLYQALKDKTYQHGNYHSFYVHDPKQRHIHKAEVKDRTVHRLLYKYLYRLFDKTFIYDSYSCRLEKGTHKAVLRLEKFTRLVSKNYTRDCWALKLDIKRFFASVNHEVLLTLLRKKIKDKDILWLLDQIIDSFNSSGSRVRPCEAKGIPLGNLTSQVFANIYLNELDQFIKHKLKVKYYLRYADDFIILANDKQSLSRLIVYIKKFVEEYLRIELHPHKVIFRKLDWGIDFLGYIVLPHHRLPRTKTKRRIFTELRLKVGQENFNQSFQSYLGYLSHANSYKLTQQLMLQFQTVYAQGLENSS